MRAKRGKQNVSEASAFCELASEARKKQVRAKRAKKEPAKRAPNRGVYRDLPRRRKFPGPNPPTRAPPSPVLRSMFHPDKFIQIKLIKIYSPE